MDSIAIAVHGGAGKREGLSRSENQQYKTGLTEAVNAGHTVLRDRGSALEAVEAAVRSLEDNPLFNSGCGGTLNYYGRHQLEAGIMCGRTRRAGAVARTSHVRNPITLARCILHNSEYVFLSGPEADDFALRHAVPMEPEEYFLTEKQLNDWLEAQRRERAEQKRHTPAEHGTVGAVALDVHGDLAAGTSTGGLVNSRYGRISDSCLVGAGVYADNGCCAVSCTGTGEYIIRAVLAHEVGALVEHAGSSLEEACRTALDRHVGQCGGEAGLIAVNTRGEIAMHFHAQRMYRACRIGDEPPTVALY